MSQVICATHGENDTTIVCVHITETLKDGLKRGFLWKVDEGGEYDAICNDCNAMPDVEWTARQVELGRVLCFGCFRRAAEMNEVVLS